MMPIEKACQLHVVCIEVYHRGVLVETTRTTDCEGMHNLLTFNEVEANMVNIFLTHRKTHLTIMVF